MVGRAGRTSGAPGSHETASAFLRVALVGPTDAAAGRMAPHTVALAHQLTRAGHDVTLVSWSAATETGTAGEPFPRTVRSLARNRPDTWLRTGRRLREYDAVVIVHTGAAMIPLHLALLRGAGVRPRTDAVDSGPRGVVLCDRLLSPRPGPGGRNLLAALLGRVHGVLVHHRQEASLATRLGAPRVYAAARPDLASPLDARTEASAHRDSAGNLPHRIPALATAEPALSAGGAGDFRASFGRLVADSAAADLSTSWATYVGAIEALAATDVAASEVPGAEAEATAPVGVVGGLAGRTGAAARRWAASRLPRVELTRSDLPEWVRATDVLDAGGQADEARAAARRLGLTRARDGIAAWAALGALAAVVRVADWAPGEGPDARRAALLVDESRSGSPLGRWARSAGFAPVDLGLTVVGGGYDLLDVDMASLDVVVRVHPGGCDASDIDEALVQAAWALRPGGLFIVTLPLGRPGVDDALGPADVRAVVARAHEHGFVLVGDLDGEVGRRMRAAGVAAARVPGRIPGAAYGLVRLTLRRR
jgi:SAM-dependent methyltransferase